MTEKVKSIERVEALLAELEPQLPSCVYFLEPLLGGELRRCSTAPGSAPYMSAPKDPPPNPRRMHPFNEGGFCPLIVFTNLFRPLKMHAGLKGHDGGWQYTIHFVLDELLTAEEVRSKVRAAAEILAAQPGEPCTWAKYEKDLEQWDKDGFPEDWQSDLPPRETPLAN